MTLKCFNLNLNGNIEMHIVNTHIRTNGNSYVMTKQFVIIILFIDLNKLVYPLHCYT